MDSNNKFSHNDLEENVDIYENYTFLCHKFRNYLKNKNHEQYPIELYSFLDELYGSMINITKLEEESSDFLDIHVILQNIVENNINIKTEEKFLNLLDNLLSLSNEKINTNITDNEYYKKYELFKTEFKTQERNFYLNEQVSDDRYTEAVNEINRILLR